MKKKTALEEPLLRNYIRALMMAAWKDWYIEETVKLVKARIEARR